MSGRMQASGQEADDAVLASIESPCVLHAVGQADDVGPMARRHTPGPGPGADGLGRLLKVGELAKRTGLSRQTIHNYTRSGLIREARWTAGGHRLYTEATAHRLAEIVALRRSRPLAEVGRLLDDMD